MLRDIEAPARPNRSLKIEFIDPPVFLDPYNLKLALRRLRAHLASTFLGATFVSASVAPA